jgi:hypothetical protein
LESAGCKRTGIDRKRAGSSDCARDCPAKRMQGVKDDDE